MLRRRDAALHRDKAPEQTFYEIFFAPTPMHWPDAGELLGLLRQQALDVDDVPVAGVLGKNERIYRATKPDPRASIQTGDARMAGVAKGK